MDKSNFSKFIVRIPMSCNIKCVDHCLFTLADIAKLKILRTQWWDIQNKLLIELTKAAEKSTSLLPQEKLKWKISTTDLEVRSAILEANDPHLTRNSLCYIRDIPELFTLKRVPNDNKLIGRFIDIDQSTMGINVEAQKLLATLREGVKHCGIPIRKYVVPWTPHGIEEKGCKDYLTELGEAVEGDLIKGIDRALETLPAIDHTLEEISQHLRLCFTRAESFFGREELWQEGLRYFLEETRAEYPLIIFGKSGYVKTSLMSKIAVEIQRALSSLHKTPLLLVRFCGTSGQSMNSRGIMESICEHISRACKASYDKSDQYVDLINKFHHALQQGTYDKPLLVFIDSLDQLTDEDLGRSNIKWIPEMLPPHCFLVMSTLPDVGGSFQYLNDHTPIPDTNYLEVLQMSKLDAEVITKQWLSHTNRTLQPEQLDYLIKLSTTKQPDVYCSRTTHILSPLKLMLLLDITVQWKSYETIEQLSSRMQAYFEKGKNFEERKHAVSKQKLKCMSQDEINDYQENGCAHKADCTSMDSLIAGFFDTLEARHGKELVSYFCGLLSVCKQGLSESHLSDMLSCASPVMETVLQYHNPPIRRLPPVIMARLRHDISSYVVERGLYDGTVLAWFHRQFVENAKRLYLPQSENITDSDSLLEIKIKYATLIAKYFSNVLHSEYPGRALERQPFYWNGSQYGTSTFNHTVLVELPYALHCLTSIEKWVSITCNLHFIALCLAAGLGRETIKNFNIRITEPRGFFMRKHGCRNWEWKSNLLKGVEEGEYLPTIYGYSNFLSSNLADLQQYPFLILQYALNLPDHHVVYKDAQSQKLSDILPWATKEISSMCRYEHFTKVQSDSPCIHTLTDDSMGEITSIQVNKGAKVLVSGNSEGKVILWGVKNGQALYTLNLESTVSQIAICNDWHVSFSLVISTVQGVVHVFWVKEVESGLQVNKGLVWQAHLISGEKYGNEFRQVPMAISKEHTCMITSGSRNLQENDIVRELAVWDMGVLDSMDRGIYPKKVEKLLVVEGGNFIREEGFYENFSLIEMFPSGEHVCIAVERMGHSGNRDSLIVICRIRPCDKIFVSEKLADYPTYLSIIPKIRPDDNGWQLAITFNGQSMFQVIEFYRLEDLNGKILFQSQKYETKSLNQVLFLDYNCVIFNHGAGLIILNLESSNYGKMPPVYLPGHSHSITCIALATLFNFDLECRQGLIFTADSSSIKVLNRTKLIDFQSKSINDRCVHSGPVKTIAVASEVGVVATWACWSYENRTKTEVKFWDVHTALPLSIPSGDEIRGVREELRNHPDTANMGIAFSADGRILCCMNIKKDKVSVFVTENIHNSEPELTGSISLQSRSEPRDMECLTPARNILSISHDGSKLSVLLGTKRGYLIDIYDSGQKYDFTKLPIAGEMCGCKITPDGKYICILTTKLNLSDAGETYSSTVNITVYSCTEYDAIHISNDCLERFTEIATHEVSIALPGSSVILPGSLTENKLGSVTSHKCSVTALDFLADEKHLVMGFGNGKLQIYTMPHLISGPVFPAHKGTITRLCTSYHLGQQYIVSSSTDGWVKLWKYPHLSFVTAHHNGSPVTCISACFCKSVSTGNDVLSIQYGDSDGRLEILEVNLHKDYHD